MVLEKHGRGGFCSLLKYMLLLVVLLNAYPKPLLAQSPLKKVWDKTFGGSKYDMLQSVTWTTDGGYLLAGWSLSEAEGDKTEPSRGGHKMEDFWLVKLDAEGNKSWDRSYGGTGNDYLWAMTLTTDGGFLLGGSSTSQAARDKTENTRGGSDFWVIKLNPDGTRDWDRSFGGSENEDLWSLTMTADGGYLLGGTSTSGAGGDKSEASWGDFDFWLLKLNPDGSKAWDRTYGGNGTDQLRSVIRTPDGGYLVGGHSDSEISGDKTQGRNGDYGSYDYWVLKLSADGSKEWDRTFGTKTRDDLTSLAITPDGGYLLGGFTMGAGTDKTEASRGGSDIWLVKLDANGNKTWDKTIGGSGGETLHTLTMTDNGGFLLGASSNSEISGEKSEASKGWARSDYWLVQIDAAGTKVWDKTIGGDRNDDLTCLTRSPDGSYLLGGYSMSGAGGDKSENSRGLFDYWVVKLSANTLGPASLPGADDQMLEVYPNPGHGNIQVALPGMEAGAVLVELVLRNALGQQMLRQTLKGMELQEGVSLSTARLTSGTYYLQVQVQEKVFTRKLVVH